MNTIIETFVGAGGAHLGFKNNNFKTIFVNDIWKESLQTLKLNNNELTDKQIICQDINELVKRDLCKEYDIKQGNLSVLIGGVVCKGFSLAGVRNPYDERNYLYLSQLKLVEQLRPKISIIENVPGMKNMKILSKKSLVNKDFTAPISKKIQIDFEESIDDLCKEIDVIITNHKNNRGQIIAVNKKLSGDIQNQELLEKKKKLEIEKLQLEKKRNVLEDTLDKYMYSVFDDIIERYKELGYNVYDKILMCSNYGGFTNRRRLIIVAVRNDLISNSQKEKIIWKWPKITNSDDIKDNLPKPMVHVEGVLTPPLPKLNTVKDAFDLLDYNNINNPKTDLDNVPMKHKQTTIEKFKLITNEKKSDG